MLGVYDQAGATIFTCVGGLCSTSSAQKSLADNLAYEVKFRTLPGPCAVPTHQHRALPKRTVNREMRWRHENCTGASYSLLSLHNLSSTGVDRDVRGPQERTGLWCHDSWTRRFGRMVAKHQDYPSIPGPEWGPGGGAFVTMLPHTSANSLTIELTRHDAVTPDRSHWACSINWRMHCRSWCLRRARRSVVWPRWAVDSCWGVHETLGGTEDGQLHGDASHAMISIHVE